MEINEFVSVCLTWLPIISSFFCILIIVMMLHEKEYTDNSLLLVIILIYFILYTIKFGSGYLYRWVPVHYALLSPLVYLSFTLLPILIYSIVRKVTVSEKHPKQAYVHVILPLLLPLMLFVWNLFIPLEVKLEIIKCRGIKPEGYEAYSFFFTSFMLTETLFSLFYLPLSAVRICQYKRRLNEEQHTAPRYALNWLTAVIVLHALVVLSYLAVVLLSPQLYFMNYLQVVFPLITTTLQVVILYNLINQNFPVLKKTPVRQLVYEPTNTTCLPDLIKQEKIKLTQDFFDQYMQMKQPYLDPTLTLLSLAEQLSVSRTTLSVFINRTYGVHFKTLIGDWRLQQLERLKKHRGRQHKPIIRDLCLQAGFPNYSSYLRARKKLDNHSE